MLLITSYSLHHLEYMNPLTKNSNIPVELLQVFYNKYITYYKYIKNLILEKRHACS